MSWRDNYYLGVETLGDETVKLPSDNDAIDQALALMDAALAEAQKMVADNSGAWAHLKASVTGAQIDTMKSAVDTFAKAASTMHDTGARLKADPNTTHDRVVDFLRSVKSITNIDALRDSANYAKLSTLVSDVGGRTLSDIGNKAKSVSASIWDAVPTSYKIVGGIAVVGIVGWKVLR